MKTMFFYHGIPSSHPITASLHCRRDKKQVKHDLKVLSDGDGTVYLEFL